MASIYINGRRVKPMTFMEFDDDDDTGVADQVEGLADNQTPLV